MEYRRSEWIQWYCVRPQLLGKSRREGDAWLDYRIPFNKPCLTGSELLYAAKAIIQGHAAGDGAFTKSCHAILEQVLGVPKHYSQRPVPTHWRWLRCFWVWSPATR